MSFESASGRRRRLNLKELLSSGDSWSCIVGNVDVCVCVRCYDNAYARQEDSNALWAL